MRPPERDSQTYASVAEAAASARPSGDHARVISGESCEWPTIVRGGANPAVLSSPVSAVGRRVLRMTVTGPGNHSLVGSDSDSGLMLKCNACSHRNQMRDGPNVCL